MGRPAADVAVDPYGLASPGFAVGEDFARMWTSALAHRHKRFEGKGQLYRREPSGGLGAFTPDSFPVFDVFRQNAYVIADARRAAPDEQLALSPELTVSGSEPGIDPLARAGCATGVCPYAVSVRCGPARGCRP